MSARECRSVLYVDDDPNICEVVQEALSSRSALQVHIAGCAERAIDLAFERRPDLILIDVMMPGIDGPTTFERIRSSPLIAEIPVIFVTAKVLPSEVAHFLLLGAIGVISKPFDLLKLGDQLLALWRTTAVAREPFATPDTKVNEISSSLAGSFLRRTRDEVVHLRDLLERALAGDRAVLKMIERIAHSIHGAAAMFGFPQLSAAGGAIERLVEGALTNTTGPGSITDLAVLNQLVEHTRRLAQAVEAAGKAIPRGEGMFGGQSTGRSDDMVAAAPKKS